MIIICNADNKDFKFSFLLPLSFSMLNVFWSSSYRDITNNSKMQQFALKSYLFFVYISDNSKDNSLF